jgi:uncharacterized protein (TIGR02145 family)
MRNKISIILLIAATIPFLNIAAQTVTDADGNIYSTVSIGNQVWLGENLRTTKFSNNDPIAMVLDSAQWPVQTAAAYCYYNNDSSYVNPYGNLYNWYTVNDARNVCPTGYHVPTAAEWADLVSFLGGETVAGGKLKEQGFSHWLSPNTGADNSSNFTALPSGWRANNNGVYENLGYMCYLWASTLQTADDADIILLGHDSPACYASNSVKLTGLPIRCIQNSGATGLNNIEKSEIIISPNPANEFLNLSIDDKMIGSNYSVTDISGKIIFTGIISNQHMTIELARLAKGIYMIQVGNNLSARFIKI